MGRLPATFGDQPIKDRFPYAMPGELIVTGGVSGIQFQDALFNNGVDKPFECHRMIPRVYALDDSNILLPEQPAQELLLGLVKINLEITNLDQRLTKASACLDTLTKGSSERNQRGVDVVLHQGVPGVGERRRVRQRQGEILLDGHVARHAHLARRQCQRAAGLRCDGASDLHQQIPMN